MGRWLAVTVSFALAACAADESTLTFSPASSEVLPSASTTLVTLPDGSIVIEEDGRLLQYDPREPDQEPVVVGPATEVGEVHAAVPRAGAILVLASGGTYILRDRAWVTSPLASALDGPIRDAIVMPTPTGRGDGDLWIATDTSLYRIVDETAERFAIEEDLSDVELALAARPEGPALWVRLPDRILEVWRDRSGVIRSARLILEGTPEAIGSDADQTGWLVIGGRLYSIGMDRRLEDRGITVGRLLASPQSRETWVVGDDGTAWLHADGRFRRAPELSLDASATMAVASDGSLYVSDGRIERHAPRRDARVSGAEDGALLVTPQVFDIEAEGAPTIEASLDGEPVEVDADPAQVRLNPTELGDGTHDLEIRIDYDDGTLPVVDRRSFEVITNATWTEDVEPLAVAYCESCHGAEGSAVTRLHTMDSWQTRIEVVIQNVDQGRMPLGRAPLTRREVALIQAWQVGGFAE